jgi:hypothetical protein
MGVIIAELCCAPWLALHVVRLRGGYVWSRDDRVAWGEDRLKQVAVLRWLVYCDWASAIVWGVGASCPVGLGWVWHGLWLGRRVPGDRVRGAVGLKDGSKAWS